MDRSSAIAMLGALAQSTRLDAFELLLKNAPQGLAAGDVAYRLSIPQNTMSKHLGTLARAGLVRAERRSRNIVYRADADRLSALTSFLSEECGAGTPNPDETKGGAGANDR
jgi:ArsR family transcriptional regulator